MQNVSLIDIKERSSEKMKKWQNIAHMTAEDKRSSEIQIHEM